MRRTAHRRRFHRDRIVRKRQREYARFRRADPEWWPLVLPDGRLENRQAYFGCSRPRCFVCHADKLLHRGADRARARREWEALGRAGWGALNER